MKRLSVLLCSLLMTFGAAMAQVPPQYELLINPKGLRSTVEDLSSKTLGGRASGTVDAVTTQQYLLGRFRSIGLKPFYWKEMQSLRYRDTTILRNIMGVIPASRGSNDYLVVSAHYDHIGTIKGTMYPGADDNASGVAAMLSLAEALMQMHRDGNGPNINILFVAFDGKEFSMSGSKYFVKHLPVSKSHIRCNLNLDIMGSTLVPVHKNRPDYMIVLGCNSLRPEDRNVVRFCNGKKKFKLDIDYTFYGSTDFTRMMYTLGDHDSFVKAGIPALFFTSGFHNHTYKPTDKPDIIDYDILAKRTHLILDVIYNLSRH